MEPDLRGPVLERSITDNLLGGFPQRDEQSLLDSQTLLDGQEPDARPYSPSSAGALPDEEEAASDAAAAQPRQGALTDDALDDPASAVEPIGRAQTAATLDQQRAAAVDADEADLVTGTVRTPRADALDDVDAGRAAADSTRATAIEGLTRTPDENPYAPLGLRLGTFIVTPTLEQGIGWTSNANLSPDGEGSTFSETALRLNAISDWSRHSATIDADVSYRKSLSGQEISEVEGGVAGQLRLDLADQWSAFVGGGYRVRPESASSPETIEDAVSRPIRHTFTGNAGVERDLGPLRLRLAGDVIRETYGDATLSGGGALPQDDRDTTLALMRMRAGYEISPALRPFVEAEIGRRSFDEEFDRNGYRRSADRYGLRAGVEVDIQEKLRGEISAGWVSENPEDERLQTMSGLSLAANLAWSPVRGTTVALDASTEVEGSTIPGKTGSLYHSASLSVSRELRHNLTGSVLAGIGWRDYFGHDESDLVLRSEASLTWWLNRYAGITGRASHEVQRGTLPDRDYDETRLYLGMTFQR
ncbi:MAG: outer membrane beta-barrel protein [Aquamicrobium sp.]|nr:outer membrane beta-barrel protein [Aquamicrobium sp.]